MDFPVYKCVIDPNVENQLGIDFIALVDKPAIEKNFLAFSKEKLRFSVDDDKRIISGPAMIADMLIYRNMEPIGEFYTVFDKETIFQVVQKFFKKGLVHSFNILHDPEQDTQAVTVYESFITDSSRGIMPMKGFEDVADGSWFISAKVDDDTIWQKIKDGELKGFSIEGLFQQVPIKIIKMNADQLVEKLKNLLECWDGN